MYGMRNAMGIGNTIGRAIYNNSDVIAANAGYAVNAAKDAVKSLLRLIIFVGLSLLSYAEILIAALIGSKSLITFVTILYIIHTIIRIKMIVNAVKRRRS